MSPEAQKIVDGPLTVSSTQYGADVIVVSLAGELDLANVSTAEKLLSAAVLAHPDLVVIDLSELEFLDSSAIALLVSLSEIPGSDTSLRIVPSPSLAVTRMLDATEIGSMIKIASDRQSLLLA
jgi:anti-anti-sigma factor